MVSILAVPPRESKPGLNPLFLLPAWPTKTNVNQVVHYLSAIYLENSTDVTFTGGGTLDGQGEAWWRGFRRGEIVRQVRHKS